MEQQSKVKPFRKKSKGSTSKGVFLRVESPADESRADLTPFLEELSKKGFRLSKKVTERALKEAGE